MQESEEVKNFVIDMYKNLTNPKYFEDKVAKREELLTIGSDESEWVKGPENFMLMVKKQAEVIPDAKITKWNPKAYVEGSIGWFNDNISIEVNNEEVSMRVTGILVKEDNNWKFMQSHWSIGIPNAQTAFGDVSVVD